MNVNDLYAMPLRKIGGGVKLMFYQSSVDDDAEVVTDRDNKPLATKSAFDLFQEQTEDQLKSYGLSPKFKYATLDGTTTFDDRGESGCYLVDTGALPTFPSWSRYICLSDGTFETGQEPVYRLDFNGAVRAVDKLMISGDAAWRQFPVKYELVLTIDGDAGTETPNNVVGDEMLEVFPSAPTVTDGKVTFSVELTTEQIGKVPVDQVVLFDRAYQAIAVTLKIYKWSTPGTTAKVMLLSNNMQIDVSADDIASLQILEEASPGADTLSYGITSNSCTVKLKDTHGRFTKYPDLLKKNRILRPYIFAEDPAQKNDASKKTSAPDNIKYLGKFYSDEWTVTGDSRYVTCKAYDQLYRLQELEIEYPLTAITTQKEGETVVTYYVDGKVSAEKCGDVPKTFEQVLSKLVRLANQKMRDDGIYGDELTFNVDDGLKNIEIDYVLLKKDTVWNMLNVLATFARANIFTGRDGSIRVTPSEKYTGIAAVGVTPDNSFSFNLPDFSKTVVNRVKAEYTEIAVGEEKDDQFEVDLSKCEKDDDNNYIVELNLTNFYGVISKEMIKRYATIDYDKTTDNELSFFADFLVGDR